MSPVPAFMLLFAVLYDGMREVATADVLKVRACYDGAFEDVLFHVDKSDQAAERMVRSLMQQANDVLATRNLHILLTEKIERFGQKLADVDHDNTAAAIHARTLDSMTATTNRVYNFLLILSANPLATLQGERINAIFVNDTGCGDSVIIVNTIPDRLVTTINFKGKRFLSDQVIVHHIVRAFFASLGMLTSNTCHSEQASLLDEDSDSLEMPTCDWSFLAAENLTQCLRGVSRLKQSGTPICGNSVIEIVDRGSPWSDESCDLGSRHRDCRTCCSPTCTNVTDCVSELDEDGICRTQHTSTGAPGSSSNIGMVVGIVMAVLVLLAVVGVVVVLIMRGRLGARAHPVKRQNSRERKKSDREMSSVFSGPTA